MIQIKTVCDLPLTDVIYCQLTLQYQDDTTSLLRAYEAADNDANEQPTYEKDPRTGQLRRVLPETLSLPDVFPSAQAPQDHATPRSPKGLRKDYHPIQSIYAEGGKNLLQVVEDDILANTRAESDNIFYPFASKEEWELAQWFTHSSLPQSEINSFLRLRYVSNSAINCPVAILIAMLFSPSQTQPRLSLLKTFATELSGFHLFLSGSIGPSLLMGAPQRIQ